MGIWMLLLVMMMALIPTRLGHLGTSCNCTRDFFFFFLGDPEWRQALRSVVRKLFKVCGELTATGGL